MPKMSKAEYTRRIARDAENRRQALIDLAARIGGKPRDICDEGGVKWTTYCGWRSKHPEFAARFDEARQSAEPVSATYDGTFVSFRKRYLRMDTTWFQNHIIDAIESARPGEVTMVLIPPGHGKTTLLEDWCTYKLVTDPSYRITVASETVDHCVKILDRVRGRFEMDGPTPAIPGDFGPIAPDGNPGQVWGQRRFNVAQKRGSDERDYSMNSVGITGRVQGTRCDLLLLDDMQDVKSLELSDKFFNIITQSFLTRPEMFGRTVIIGTRVGEFDVYRKLIDAEIPDRLIRIPAYDVVDSPPWPEQKVKPAYDDESTWAPEGTKFLWPQKYDQVEEGGAHQVGFERFNYARLRKRIGEQAWWRNYMQKPEAASNMTFDEDTTDKMKDDQRSIHADARPITPHEDPSLDPEQWPDGWRPVPIVVAVDPSIGGGNAVMAVAARPKTMEILTAHLVYNLTKYGQLIQLIEQDCARFSTPRSVIAAVVIESNAFQKGLLQDDDLLALQKRYGFRIMPNRTGANKADPDIGVPSLAGAMLRQEISIPWGDEDSMTAMADLLDHLHQWRTGVSGAKLPMDLVMTTWFAYRQWLALRDTPVQQHTDTSAFRAATSPLNRRRPRSISRRGYRTVRGRR